MIKSRRGGKVDLLRRELIVNLSVREAAAPRRQASGHEQCHHEHRPHRRHEYIECLTSHMSSFIEDICIIRPRGAVCVEDKVLSYRPEFRCGNTMSKP